jgi:phosphate:Na+ symporter
MDTLYSVLKLAGGIGLFLFAMYLIEESLKNLSGRNFKIFLQRIAKNKIGAVSGGAIVTGVLQSSSMVILMVVAFVGAGVFTMKNAFAIILGANLGTTIDSWLVATVGFKMNIEVVSYPAVFVGGLLLILFNKRTSIKYLAYFLFGFGLLFIGLSFMKTSMEAQVSAFDFSKYIGVSPVIFLLIGFLITLLVQSSSVTMALTLSALNAGVVDFNAAAVIVLGSETGTTIKILISAIGGTASKKRVVLGNLFFNLFLTFLAFLFLKPMLFLITDIFNINNPLIGLVTFSSMVNLVGIIMFLPFLNPFAKFLEKFYTDTDSSVSAFISQANSDDTDTAIDLFRKEAEYFIHNSLFFNLLLLEVDTEFLKENSKFEVINLKRKFSAKTTEEKYIFLKQLQGELQVFYLELRTKIDDDQVADLNQLISAVRSSMHSVKSMTDIETNISNLKRSSKDIKYEFFLLNKKITDDLYHTLNILLTKEKNASFGKLHTVFNDIQDNYSAALNSFYKEAQISAIEDLDYTTVINFNRELFTSNKAMLMAVKDFLLEEKQAEEFNDIVIYKT